MSNITTLGIDLAKSTFQVCGLNQARQSKFNKAISRAKFVDTIRQYPNALIAMEACASAHHWARIFTEMGYDVRLIPAQHVKAFCRGNKTDRTDALAIAEAADRPNLHPVQPKTIEQQDIQALLRIRSKHKVSRTQYVNQIRGLLAEYGIIMPKSLVQFNRHMPAILNDVENGLTPLIREQLKGLFELYLVFSQKINEADIKLKDLAAKHPIASKLMKLRGVGPISAMAIFACIGNGHQFTNARQLSAWVGLVPKQNGTGGHVNLGSISKRGNAYLRMLLIHGGRTVMNWAKNKTDAFSLWAKAVADRRGRHKAIVAVANKTARMIWVVLNKGTDSIPNQYLSAMVAK